MTSLREYEDGRGRGHAGACRLVLRRSKRPVVWCGGFVGKRDPTVGTGMQRRRVLLLAVALGLGAAARVWLCVGAPERGYVWDHFDTIGMGYNAGRLGLLRIYSVGFADLAPVSGQVFNGERFQATRRKPVVLPNYPPLAILFFRVQAAILESIDHPLRANTFTARLVMAGVPFVFELATALGLLLIGRHVATEREGILAAVILWCFPPVMMNSTLWGQVDAFVLAPSVLACLCMIRHRWPLAGVCLGVAVLLKPQGFILAPMALYGAFVCAGNGQVPTGWEVVRRLAWMIAGAGATVACVGLPWTFAAGLAWVRRCYVHSFMEAFPDTTLFAFNFWYVDALRHDGELAFVLDSTVRVLGLSKDAWGRALSIAALGATTAISWHRYHRSPAGLVLFAALWLWSLFVWPTRVHERFIIYCAPFVVAVAALDRRYWPVLLGLLVVGMAEHSWNQWLKGPPAGTLVPRRSSIVLMHQRMAMERPESQVPSMQELEAYHLREAASRRTSYERARQHLRPYETALTLVSLLSYAGAFLVSFLRVGSPRSGTLQGVRRDSERGEAGARTFSSAGCARQKRPRKEATTRNGKGGGGRLLLRLQTGVVTLAPRVL